MDRPLMPTATAVWLIDNTSLTFKQIAEFCDLHNLEVEGIANGDVAHGVKGFDPIANGQLTTDAIENCQKDPDMKLTLATKKDPAPAPERRHRQRPRYTPVSRRRDRPDAIAWLVRNHPEITDGQIGRLIGTTKSTIAAVRDRTHWNAHSIKPVDPVSLGLCKQAELDTIVIKAARRAERKEKEKRRAAKKEQRAKQNEAMPETSPETVQETAQETVQDTDQEAAPEVTFDLPRTGSSEQ